MDLATGMTSARMRQLISSRGWPPATSHFKSALGRLPCTWSGGSRRIRELAGRGGWGRIPALPSVRKGWSLLHLDPVQPSAGGHDLRRVVLRPGEQESAVVSGGECCSPPCPWSGPPHRRRQPHRRRPTSPPSQMWFPGRAEGVARIVRGRREDQ